MRDNDTSRGKNASETPVMLCKASDVSKTTAISTIIRFIRNSGRKEGMTENVERIG